MVPRALGETMHGTEVADVLYFVLLHLGVSDLSMGSAVVDGMCLYLPVLVDDARSYIWLGPSLACTAEGAMKIVLKWCTLFRAQMMFVCDTALILKTR